MTKISPSNLPASVKARLLNRSRADQQNLNLYFTRYASERLLYRLSMSPYANDFILKGAMLFLAWSDLLLRPTMDLDLLGYGEDSAERFERIFRDLASMPIEPDDALVFDRESVRATSIRDEQEYQGKRVTLLAYLGAIPIKVQVDIGIGDVITPGPELLEFPGLLDLPRAMIRGSTRETVVAEKLHVMVTRGLVNSRLKDYFDIWVLSQGFTFDGIHLRTAIDATFRRRRTDLGTTLPLALTPVYAQEPGRAQVWSRFLAKTDAKSLNLVEAIAQIAAFLGPVIAQVDWSGIWKPAGPWSR